MRGEARRRENGRREKAGQGRLDSRHPENGQATTSMEQKGYQQLTRSCQEQRTKWTLWGLKSSTSSSSPTSPFACFNGSPTLAPTTIQRQPAGPTGLCCDALRVHARLHKNFPRHGPDQMPKPGGLCWPNPNPNPNPAAANQAGGASDPTMTAPPSLPCSLGVA